MGRTSKFSFPMPGRKAAATKEKERVRPKPTVESSGLSKAQRILGTGGDLNIDSPSRDDDVSWRYPSSRSSDMSISISESTHSIQSTNNTESIHESVSEQWDHESEGFASAQLHNKASSTLLGRQDYYRDDAAADTSSVRRRMRREDSSSTLKSYYDRQKSPPAISQQSSNSSARDLALRKGYPPVLSSLPRSPLLQVESSMDAFEEQFVDGLHSEGGVSRDGSMRKKPARLDLAMLFPSRKRRSDKIPDESLNQNPSSAFTHTPNNHGSQKSSAPRRKLTKAQSKESMRSQQSSLRSSKSHDPRSQRETTDSVSSLYNSYGQSAMPPLLSQIPESRVPDREPEQRNGRRTTEGQATFKPGRNPRDRPDIPLRFESTFQERGYQTPPDVNSHARKREDSRSHPERSDATEEPSGSADKEPFSWKHVRESMISPPWDSSAASISSRNTKTSRRSAFSNIDLTQNSVLSLSSDSEDEESDVEPLRSPAESSNDKVSLSSRGALQRPLQSRRQSSQPTENIALKKQPSRKGAAQGSTFLRIPETSAVSSRLSGPWSPPKLDNPQSLAATRSLDKRERRSSGTPSSSIKRLSNQLTPPVSPHSTAPRQAETENSRVMAVTRQEEALLEALRQKRARMKEKIIHEHETAKSPPQALGRKASRYSEASSVSTIRGLEIPNEQHQILLYLDTPLDDGHAIDTAEPSPDLSDFLSFGSDEDPTPKASWAPPRRGQPRPDSSAVSSNPKGRKIGPRTPPSVARLSAVGASSGFRDERSSKLNSNAGVRFVDDAKMGPSQSFFLDEGEDKDETDVIWGM